MGSEPHAVEHVERRARQRPVQVRRRRLVDRDHEEPRPAGRAVGQGRRVGVGADGNRVYAIIENEAAGGLYLSDDAGATWKLVNDNRNMRQRAFYALNADPVDKDTVYVLNVQFFKSTDAGKTTTTIRVPHGDNHDLWISSTNNKRMVQSNDGSANVTWNGGETWTEQDIPTGQFYNVFTTKHVPYHICGAQQDNSTRVRRQPGQPRRGRGQPAADLLRRRRRRERLHRARSERPQRLLRRQLRRLSEPPRSRDRPAARGEHLSEQPDGLFVDRHQERFQWTYPIVFSPVDAKVLYATSQHVWRRQRRELGTHQPKPARSDEDDAGVGGTDHEDQTGVETYAVVFTLAPSRQDVNTLWAGSDDGWVHVTRDSGKNWERITPPICRSSRASA